MPGLWPALRKPRLAVRWTPIYGQTSVGPGGWAE